VCEFAEAMLSFAIGLMLMSATRRQSTRITAGAEISYA